MATKLKNLKIKKVDFVDEGANPDADIKMKKRKEKEQEGQPGEDISRKGADSIRNRLLGFIGKAVGMDQSEIDDAMDEIQKSSSTSFREKIDEFNNRKIADEIWDICYALQSSFCSILNDEEIDKTNMESAMQESLDEFYAVAKESISKWSSGKTANIVKKQEALSETELEVMKAAAERLSVSIQKACMDSGLKEKTRQQEPNDNGDESKGDETKMKIDKSRMTEAEKAFLESIEKRYGMEEGTVSGEACIETAGKKTGSGAIDVPTVNKSITQAVPETVISADEAEDIYKGLHPAVRAELEGLKKFREEAEARELTEVAKRYVIIGKKEDELVPLFKSLRAAGGTAYNDMIALLDQAVVTVEKSGAFSEIGRSGHGSGSSGAAEARIDTIAKGYMEKDSSLDYTAAVAKAWEDNPELMDEYEEEAGF